MNSTTDDGEKMEKQMWEDIKAKNWKVVENKIAEGFQSVHPDGARDRAGEISLIKNLSVGQIALSDFKSTMNGDNIVVTYMISVQETIDLERLPTKPASRLSVWKKGASGWQWISHANLNPIP
ncbi:MAG: nuclear transport factor 2 family protein [Candidatus Udaeobacter sp.]